MDKQPQRLAQNKTDLMPNNASCKRWDTLGHEHTPESRICILRGELLLNDLALCLTGVYNASLPGGVFRNGLIRDGR